MDVLLTAQAERDLDAHVAYVLARNPDAARRLATDILDQIASLSVFPSRTRQGRVPGTRELVITGYPYIVVFEIAAQEILILHINHARQQWPRAPLEEDGPA